MCVQLEISKNSLSHCPLPLEMKPDPEYVEKEAKHEENELKNLEKTISEEERVVIREKTKELEDWQANNNDPSCLPSLTLGDVSLVSVMYINPQSYF